MKSAGGTSRGLLRRLHVEGDAGRHEDLGPPRHQLIAPGARLVTVLQMRRRTEGNVICARLGERHGVVARDAGVDADDAARADDAAGGLVGSYALRAGLQMHAVGEQGAREGGVARNEGRNAGPLRQLDQRPRVVGFEAGCAARDDEHRG
jgi:hypothetical protein